MEIIPQLISRYSIVLYAVCAIACLYFVFSGMASLRELRRAVFRLERNAVVTRAMSSILKALLCVVIGVVIFAITAFAPAPAATSSLLGSVTGTPSQVALPTSMPTAVITSSEMLASVNFTPTLTFANGTLTVTAEVAATGAAPAASTAPAATAPVVASTATPEPTPIPTTAAPPSPDLVADCTNPTAQITNPGPSEQVIGAYTIRGTAMIEAGGWYKLEILMPGSSQWAFLGRGDAAVSGGVLMNNFPAGNIAPGAYPLRLVLVGADSGVRAICRVPITIGS
jgi:hypothetical protein